MRQLTFALIGMSGFGQDHLQAAERLEREGLLRLKAVCDINYEANIEKIEQLSRLGVVYYNDYKQLLKNEKELDFVAISTPLHTHTNMSIDVMNAGFHVLLEKPPAVTVQDVDKIINTSEKTGRYCAIDFVLTSEKAFLELKKIIAGGRLGKIKTISGIGLIKRYASYFNRTSWAGKLVMNNNYVLDGPINNPLAHLLNNMVLLSCEQKSDREGQHAYPTVAAVRAELYHGYDIESEDTSCVEVDMDNGVNLYYYATLCNNTYDTPYIVVEGTKGKAVWHYNNNKLDVFCDGKESNYDFGPEHRVDNIYRNLCHTISGRESELFCPVQHTRNFVLVSNGAFESSGIVHDIGSSYKYIEDPEGNPSVCIQDIHSIIKQAARQKALFSDIGVEWATASQKFDLKEYKKFSLFIEG